MCVAVPGRVEWIGPATAGSIPARINIGDRMLDVDLITLPQARIGDFVVAHSGYAVRLVSATEAAATRQLLDGSD